MPSTFLSLQIGYSALQATSMGVSTTGHNIANASTPGYAREVVDAETANSLQSFTDHVSYLGQGVNGKSEARIVDESLNSQYRTNNGQQAFWQTKSTEINGLAQIFNEPTGTTLRSAMESFFGAWSQLAGDPSDGGVRANVYEASQTLAAAFHTTAKTLQDNQTRYQTELSDGVSVVNTLVQNIADLNKEINQAAQRGGSPNDLLDQRDALLDKLSSYAGITVTYTQDPSYKSVTDMAITLNLQSGSTFGSSVTLLNNDAVYSKLAATGSSAVSTTAGTTGGTPNTVAVKDLVDENGSLVSLYDMGNYAGNVLGQVNSLAKDLATDVDNIHAGGYGANNDASNSEHNVALFNSAALATSANAALDIAVNSAITPNSLDLLAASQTDTVGKTNQTDGSNAAAIADLLMKYEQGTTGTQGYAPIVTQLGTDGQAATQKNQTFTALSTQVTQLRQSVSGVNINEEMMNMVQYQQSYTAASKFISVFNDMLTTLIQTA